MQVKSSLNKKDVITGYVARGVSMSFGLITLPIILHQLSEGEIALNYIMQTLIAIVALFDMGFSQQFARSFAFVFGGAQELTEEGVPTHNDNFVNYELLYRLIRVARKFYSYMTIVVVLFLLTFGTWYIYHFTEGFTLVNNTLPLWFFFSFSIAFDFYYKYFVPLLMGKGLITELNKIELYSTLVRIAVLFVLIFAGLGLWALVISSFVRLLIVRLYSVHCFYSNDIKDEFERYKNNDYDDISLLKVLWYNAKKKLLVSVATYAVMQLGMFLTGIYLNKSEVASYGLLMQFLNLIASLAMLITNNTVAIFSTLRTQGNTEKLKENFFFSVGVCYYFYIFGYVGVAIMAPFLLDLIGANASLPAFSIMTIAFIHKLLESRYIICSTYLTTQNIIVDFHSSIIIGIVTALGQWLVLQYTSYGILGLFCIQLFISLCYCNWKWPFEVCKEFSINYAQFVYNAFYYTNRRLLVAIRI